MKEIKIFNISDYPQIDYSNSCLKYDFFGYSAVNNGTMTVDGKEIRVTKDLMTIDQFKAYKECGMTIMFPQVMLAIEDDIKSVERAKHFIDLFVKQGIDKTIVYDSRISNLSKVKGGIVGSDKQFKNYDELDEYLYESLKRYVGYPGLYGVMIGDEPKYYHLDSYSDVYNSITRLKKKYDFELFIQYNLNPFCDYEEGVYDYSEHVAPHETAPLTRKAAYKNYVCSFLDRMGVDHIQFDVYPYRINFMNKFYITSFEINAEIAKERGIDLYTISQTFAMTSHGKPHYRKQTPQELRYLNNMQLAFGVKKVGYFTYFTKAQNNTNGEAFIDNCSFINRHGKKTYIYHTMKKLINENQSIANITLNFKYNTRQLYTMYPMDYDTFHLQYIEKDGVFEKLKNLSIDKDCCYVTESIDNSKGNYMYSIMNVVDPRISARKATNTATFEFDKDEYNKVMILKEGNKYFYKLNDGLGSVKLKPGDAVIIIPFK